MDCFDVTVSNSSWKEFVSDMKQFRFNRLVIFGLHLLTRVLDTAQFRHSSVREQTNGLPTYDCNFSKHVYSFCTKMFSSLSLDWLLGLMVFVLNCSSLWLCTCMPYLAVLAKYCYLLLTHFHVVSHIFLDADRAAFLHPDRLEFATARKCIFTDLLERAGERDFFNLAIRETLFSDVLHAIRDLDASETVSVREHPCLNPFQRRREFDTLYRRI